MKYGPHSESVEEAIEFFLNSPHLLRRSDIAMPDGIKLTNNIADLFNYIHVPPGAPDDAVEWVDIKRLAGTYDLTFSEHISSESINNGLCENLEPILNSLETRASLRRRTPSSCLDKELVINLILDDAERICTARGVVGRSNDFVELLFKLHTCGVLPCGWDGIYPDGNMVAYYCE